MPNASRYLGPGYTYHLTHRCHDRRFLLRTIRERHDYRKWLREGANRYDVPIYNYCVTSNHVHVIVHVEETDTESLAIGDRIFVERAAKSVGNRYRFIYGDAGTSSPCATCVYEAGESYSPIQQPLLSAKPE